MEIRFESLKISFDEFASVLLNSLDKFETKLIQKKSKFLNYENDSNVNNGVLEINLKNFPFKSFNLIKQMHIGCTDLITMTILIDSRYPMEIFE